MRSRNSLFHLFNFLYCIWISAREFHYSKRLVLLHAIRIYYLETLQLHYVLFEQSKIEAFW